MNTEAKERAEEVAAMPHVQRWMRRFRKLCNDMPPEVWVFVASGTPSVMATSETGERYESGRGHDSGVDRDAIIDANCVRGWDGGDW